MVDEFRNHKIQLARDSDTTVKILMEADIDIAGKLWTGRREILSSDRAVMETVFGWTVTGLPTNHELALSRVSLTAKNLKMNMCIFNDYNLILESWLNEGIPEEAKDASCQRIKHDNKGATGIFWVCQNGRLPFFKLIPRRT
ncbi:hypothetical protein PR048_002570 [Dryococelus australis]|uniref:Uncharacterized protein n=1 Tax=Dryococelus australis TaxID=614101 RepID=A0ABQ9IKN9_9NEOP|nr:hypothetical protein PR048_002570 [Dryococelus australis]